MAGQYPSGRKTIYADGVTEAFAELGRYLAFEGRIPEARACYEYVLDWNAETELPDAFTKELADLLDSTAEVADFDDVCAEFGLEPGADSEVLEAMEKAMKVAENKMIIHHGKLSKKACSYSLRMNPI